MGSTWEPTRKRISGPDGASIRYSLYEGVGRSAWTQKRSLLYVVSYSLSFKLQGLTCLTRRRHFALKQPWHGTLCIPFSSLVAPKARSSTGTSPRRQQGHPQIPNCPIIVRRCNLARIARRIGARSTSTSNPPSRDAFPSARLKRLGAGVPPARPPARL